MAEMISEDDVRYVAHLAQLEVSDAEVSQFAEELGAVLGHARDMEALALDDIPPLAHVLGTRNVLRPDEVRPCLDRDEVLSQAPSAEDGRFRVPRILGEEA
jgi:aspartyl-tRNA(Asn)/glutamyl-tRNA(Gln) amidotransferase subunit C